MVSFEKPSQYMFSQYICFKQFLPFVNPGWKVRNILLYTFPAMEKFIPSFIPLKSFICFEALLGIGIMMFSRHHPGLVVHLECLMY